jgi:hypothetical protein
MFHKTIISIKIVDRRNNLLEIKRFMSFSIHSNLINVFYQEYLKKENKDFYEK